MSLPASAIRVIERVRLGFVATVDAEGRPCVSPKGTFVVLGPDRIAFGDIRSPGTVANLRANPACEVNFVDPFLRKGVRVRGSAAIVEASDAAFGGMIGQWRDIWGDLADRVARIVAIDVTEAKPLTTPPYDDGVTEAEMIALYKAKYAEMYP